MNKIKMTIPVLCAALLMGGTVYAGSIKNAEYDTAAGKLTVSGTADRGKVLNFVSLRILKPGVYPEDLDNMTEADKKANLVYLEQKEAAADGTFEFTYVPKSAVNGNYNIYVKDSADNEYYSYVLIMDSAKDAELLRDINGAGTKEAMNAAITKHLYALTGLKTFDEISAEYTQNEVIESISEMLVGKTFQRSADFAKEAVSSAVVMKINKLTSAAEFKTAAEKYKDELGIGDSRLYTEIFKKYFTDDMIAADFLNKNYASQNAFRTAFLDDVVVKSINNVVNKVEVISVIEAGRDYLSSFDFAGYDALTSTQKAYVGTTVANSGTFSSVEEIKEKFNTAVKNAPNGNSPSNTGGGSGGSGSGGGSSSSSSGMGVPSITTPSAEKEIFSDLSKAEWAKESINALYKKGIVSGISENEFAPLGEVTREQFAKMAVTACDLYSPYESCGFEDVLREAWYYPYVASAVKAGIVYGTEENLFGTGSRITREDMAVMAYRAAKKAGYINLSAPIGENFADDNEISDYAKEAVYLLKANNIMSGKENNRFEAKAYATRAEAARIIYGMLKTGGKL